MKDLGHGANVDEMARLYGKNPKEIIDFSSNINPNVLPNLERYILKGYESGWVERWMDLGGGELER